MNRLLSFSINNFELMDQMNDSLFRKVRIRAFASGDNAHTLPVSEDVLRRGAKTIYDKPIVWKYDKYFDDATTHEKDEVPCGFVKESEDNPIIFEEDMGKTFIVINALIWVKYCGHLLRIFERDDMRKDVSIEIATIEKDHEEGEKPEITDFVVAGITILGEYVEPACKGCRADLLQFSIDKAEYLNSLEFAEGSIKIDNSKDSATNGTWSNPRRKLFNPISKATNRKALLKEAYLVGQFDTDNPEITKFKYPHHVIKDGKLVIHTRGVEAAFQRASQQGIVNGNVKAHLLRHYHELGLNIENFVEFGMTEEDFNLYFSGIKEGDNEMAEKENKEKMTQEDMAKEKEEMACDNKMAEKETEKEKMACDQKMADEPSQEDSNSKEKKVDDDDDDDDDDKEESKENMAKKIQVMAEENDKLKKENAAYMAKFEAMADYENLKKFKENTEKKMAQEEQMAKMEKVMSEIENKGVKMSDEEKKKLFAKQKEFATIEAWANFAKASVFDNVERLDGITSIGFAYNTTNTANDDFVDIWDKI